MGKMSSATVPEQRSLPEGWSAPASLLGGSQADARSPVYGGRWQRHVAHGEELQATVAGSRACGSDRMSTPMLDLLSARGMDKKSSVVAHKLTADDHCSAPCGAVDLRIERVGERPWLQCSARTGRSPHGAMFGEDKTLASPSTGATVGRKVRSCSSPQPPA